MNEYTIAFLPRAYREVVRSESKSRRFLNNLRFAGGAACPGCRDIVKITPDKFNRKHRCPECGRRFNDFSGTMLASAKLPCSIIIMGAQLFIEGISANEASLKLGVNYKTALRLYGNIRRAVLEQHHFKKPYIAVNQEKRKILIKPGFVSYLKKPGSLFKPGGKRKLKFSGRVAADKQIFFLKGQEFRYARQGRPETLVRLLGYLVQTNG